MKKTLLTAAFAALALGAAQAVTVDWSAAAAESFVGQTSANQLSNKLTSANAWTVGAVLTVKQDIVRPSGNAWPSIIGVTTTADNESAYRFVLNYGSDGNGEVSLTGPGGNIGLAGSSLTLQAGKSYEFVLSYSGSTLSFYIDGTLYGNTTIEDGTAFNQIVWGKQGKDQNRLWDANNTDTYSMDVYYTTSGAYDDVVATHAIPEPTALALLALGVAGVAFRRRVA